LRTAYAVNKGALMAVGAIVLVVAALAAPVKQRCGAPGYACATTVDAQGYLHYYYEVEPLGVFLAELVTGTNIKIFYTSGENREKLR
jgi:hypothetical protein